MGNDPIIGIDPDCAYTKFGDKVRAFFTIKRKSGSTQTNQTKEDRIMEGAFIGSIVFEFVGVFFRWLYIAFIRKLKGKKVVSFGKVWKGRDNDDFSEDFEYGVSNIFLGMTVTIAIILILKLILG